MVARLVAVLVLVPVAASSQAGADPVRAPACKDAAPHAAKVRALTQVDWCNIDLFSNPRRGGTLRGGRSSVHMYRTLGEAHDTIAVSLRGVVYGDLDGDRRKEAALVLERTMWIARTNRSSTTTDVAVFRLVRGRPEHIASAPADAVVDIAMRGGVLTVTSGATGAARTITRYQLAEGELVELPATK